LNEDDRRLTGESSSYLWGEDFVVSPVVEAGRQSKQVYLPSGVWFDFWTDERITGGREVTAPAPIDRVPLFVREGALVPMAPLMNYSNERPLDTLVLHVYPVRGGESSFTLYEDDGESLDYQRGEFATTTFSQSASDSTPTRTVQVTIGRSEGRFKGKLQRRTFVIEMHGVARPPRRVVLNNVPLSQRGELAAGAERNGYRYEKAAERLVISVQVEADSKYAVSVEGATLSKE
jgi:alpha-glucosidase (family GH31 glycosyl hydrolase)